MRGKSNATKDAHLGMSHGKATNMLRKKIMFSLVQRLSEDVCFKCGSKIETVQELSVEHKVPWLYGDIDLYWNLDNIAFSHLRCNTADRPHTPPRRVDPDGMAWCYKCKSNLQLSSFDKDASRWRGHSSICKTCYNEARKKRRYANVA